MRILVISSILVDDAKREQLKAHFFDEHYEIVPAVQRNHLFGQDLKASICSYLCDEVTLDPELVLQIPVVLVWSDGHLLSENGFLVIWIDVVDRQQLIMWPLWEICIRLLHFFLEGLDICCQSFDSLVYFHDPVSSTRDYTVLLLVLLRFCIDFSIRIARVLLVVSRLLLLKKTLQLLDLLLVLLAQFHQLVDPILKSQVLPSDISNLVMQLLLLVYLMSGKENFCFNIHYWRAFILDFLEMIGNLDSAVLADTDSILILRKLCDIDVELIQIGEDILYLLGLA